MSNIRKLRLADTKVVDGKEVKEGATTIPALLNNRALRYGISSGMIQTTNLVDLYEKISENVEDAWVLLYIAAYGADKEFIKNYTLDEFIEVLDEPVAELTYLAQTVINGELPETFDEFIKELQAKTENSTEKK